MTKDGGTGKEKMVASSPIIDRHLSISLSESLALFERHGWSRMHAAKCAEAGCTMSRRRQIAAKLRRSEAEHRGLDG